MADSKDVAVTGVSTGIGRGTTKVLVSEGFRVFGSVLKQVDADRLQREFGNGVVPLKKSKTVADILERELQPTIKEWLRRVNMVPELTVIPLSDADRTAHLPKLYEDLISRLRLAGDAESPVSISAAAHGRARRAQGYSVSMLIRESRVFQVATFNTLNIHHRELDQNRVLSDVVVIADEVDAQLMETARSLAQ